MARVKRSGESLKFYDSNTGNLLFEAPKGRSHDHFWKESNAHGWPSFRDEEVNWEYVRCLRNGECVSIHGTHLVSILSRHSAECSFSVLFCSHHLSLVTFRGTICRIDQATGTASIWYQLRGFADRPSERTNQYLLRRLPIFKESASARLWKNRVVEYSEAVSTGTSTTPLDPF
jgi:hypothetical protein